MPQHDTDGGEAKFPPEDNLARLRDEVEGLDWPLHFDWQLVEAEQGPFISAEAQPFAGVAGIDPSLLSDHSSSLFVAAHERVHLQLGMQLRQTVVDDFPEIDNYWQDQVKHLKLGEIGLLPKNRYLEAKEWESLYPRWSGPAGITKEAATETIRNFFQVVSKGLISTGLGMREYSHPSPIFRSWQQAISTSDKPIEALEEQYSDNFLHILATGYALGDYLLTAYRDAESNRSGVDLWEAEEGFANYVASKLSGVAIEDTQHNARQDTGKIRMAYRVGEIASGQKTPLEQVVLDYSTLANLLADYRL